MRIISEIDFFSNNAGGDAQLVLSLFQHGANRGTRHLYVGHACLHVSGQMSSILSLCGGRGTSKQSNWEQSFFFFFGGGGGRGIEGKMSLSTGMNPDIRIWGTKKGRVIWGLN